MKKVLALIVILVIAGGGTYLASQEIAPEIQKVEKVLPNDRFLK